MVPKPKMLSFWMAKTQLQLSIAFLNDKGRILSIQEMKPEQTQERYRSPEPARYAIEVNQGWFAKHEIEVGDVVELHRGGANTSFVGSSTFATWCIEDQRDITVDQVVQQVRITFDQLFDTLNRNPRLLQTFSRSGRCHQLETEVL